jgi:rare lipoprotein A
MRLVDSRTISGQASYYDSPGNLMANGQLFDRNAMNAAMLGVPLGTTVTVALAANPARSITVRITDHGPYVPGRVIDLTPAAFVALVGSLNVGVTRVVVTIP